MSEPADEETREFLARNSPEYWTQLREEAVRRLEEADTPVTPGLVDAEAVAIFCRVSADNFAKVEEFIPTEERSRIYREEEARLRWLYPEGFANEAVLLDVMRRFKEEYPEAFRS